MNMSEINLIIIGAGGHGRVIADTASLCGYKNIRFLDERKVAGLPVIGKVADYSRYLDEAVFIVGIGDNKIREHIYSEMTAKGAKMISLVHPRAFISTGAAIGSGVVVMAGAAVNTGAVLGNGVIVNTCGSVDHDCKVDDFCHISVGAHLAGTVNVGNGTLIGVGASVISNIDICGGCVVGAGAAVVKNLTVPGIYKGVPARLDIK